MTKILAFLASLVTVIVFLTGVENLPGFFSSGNTTNEPHTSQRPPINPGGVYRNAQSISQSQADEISEEWQERFTSAIRSHDRAVLKHLLNRTRISFLFMKCNFVGTTYCLDASIDYIIRNREIRRSDRSRNTIRSDGTIYAEVRWPMMSVVDRLCLVVGFGTVS